MSGRNGGRRAPLIMFVVVTAPVFILLAYALLVNQSLRRYESHERTMERLVNMRETLHGDLVGLMVAVSRGDRGEALGPSIVRLTTGLDGLAQETQGKHPAFNETLDQNRSRLSGLPAASDGEGVSDVMLAFHGVIFPALNDIITHHAREAKSAHVWVVAGLTIGVFTVVAVIILAINWRLRRAVTSASQRARDLIGLSEHIGDGLIIIDVQGTVESFNPAAESAFGYARDEVIGRNVSMLLPENERDHHDAYVRGSNLHASRIINRVRDLWGRRKDGSLFPMELNVARLGNSKGAPSFVGVFRDISDRKDMEQRLITERNAAELARRSAQAASQAKSQFLAAMSHELRTPLNAILGFGQMLGSDKFGSLNDLQKEYLGFVMSSANHLLQLINELLELSRIEAGQAEFSLEALDPDEVIQSALEVARLFAAENDVTIVDRRSCHAGAMILADPVRFNQILLNLLTNAVKYNRLGGQVYLEDELIEGRYLRLLVSDTGFGIKEQDIPNLFASFHRLGAEATNIEGTGIGLFLTRRLVEAMNGHIGFETKKDEGSTFWFELPLAAEEREDAGANAMEDLSSSALHHVLLVDDNPVNIRLVGAVARQVSGMGVVAAHNGEIALALARDRPPAMILIDLDLPGLNPAKFIRELESLQDAGRMRRVVLADGAAAVEVLRRNLGHEVESLQKPLRIDSLRNLLNSLELGSALAQQIVAHRPIE